MKEIIDEKDIEIIKILEKNAKTKIHTIAKKLGIPSSTVHHRIKKLEKNSIIKKWTIKKNYKNMGQKIKAYILVFVDVTALKKMRKTQKDIAGEMKKIYDVESVDIITGEADLIAVLRCRDIEDLEKTLLEKIQKIDGITKTKTIISVMEAED
ncbi:Lrp/AsnC family transcriptional regulator [Candidatus Micrarchaeota archaeon]|nr:Lrp/AsnC family transcriptional regulator [Candidatus Micrarchaeota archaeon]